MIRPRAAATVAAASLLVVTVGACSGDDAGPPTPAATESTAPTPTDPPTTATTTAPTTPSTDPPATTSAPPTTPATSIPDVEAIKAQIAADYERSEALRNELVRNPTLDDLETRASTISAAGSPDYEGLVALVRELVETGDRLFAGEPDLNSVRVERVALSVSDATVATVTACVVFNDRRITTTGETVGDTGVLSAARVDQEVRQTANGWLPAGPWIILDAAEQVVECPPAK